MPPSGRKQTAKSVKAAQEEEAVCPYEFQAEQKKSPSGSEEDIREDRNQDVGPFVSSTVAPAPQPEEQQLRKKRARMIAEVLTSLQDLAKAKRKQHLTVKKQPALAKAPATQARSLQANCSARKDITVRAWMSRLEKRLDHIEAMIGRVEERLDAAFRRGAFF